MTSPTLRPAFPWYLGGHSVAAPGSETGPDAGDWIPKTVTIDGYVFPVDLTGEFGAGGWQSGPLDTFRDALAPSDLPNDTLFNAHGAWARYAYSWHHGSGQSLNDLDDTSDKFRYGDTDRVDWSTKYQLQLTHTAIQKQSDAASAPVMISSGIYVFMGAGTSLYRTSDLVTWTAMTAPGGTVQALSTDGSDLYVATSTKLTRYQGTGTADVPFGTPVAVNTDNVAFVAGHLLVGQGAALKEVAASGALTTIKTHYNTNFRWTTIFCIGSRIYVGGFAGTKSEIHTLIADSNGNLVQGQEAAPLPLGELLRFGLAYSGECVLCTSNGVRFAEVSGDGTLTYGPLISDVGDTRCACADGRFVFTGWSSMLAATRSGVCRFAVDDEVNSLQPAYANDVSTGTVATVTGVARLGGKTAFSMSAQGAFADQTGYEGQGFSKSGQIFFGTVEPKILTSLDLSFLPLLSGQTIKGTVRDQAGSLVNEAVASTVDSQSFSIDLSGTQVTSAEVTVTLLGAGSSTPTLKHWRVRGYPVAPETLQWIIPVIVKDTVIVGANEGVKRSMNVPDMHLWAEDLHSSKRLTVLRINERAYNVRLEKYEFHGHSWDRTGDGPQGVLLVQLIATA